MVKKYLMLFLCILKLSFLQADAYTLKTGIIYNAETARVEAFSNIPLSLNLNEYSKYNIDNDSSKNIEAAKNGKRVYKRKKITLFSDGDYSIKYLSNKNNSYFYSQNGILKIISIQYSSVYPIKCVRYNSNGSIDSISFSVSYNEQYIFDYKGHLMVHWIGNNCYNEKGELIGTRK